MTDSIKLEGNFYKMSDLQEKLNISAMQAHKITKKYKEKFVLIGQTYLIPEDVANLIIAEYGASKNQSFAFYMLADKLDCQLSIIQALVDSGLPTIAYGKKQRVSLQVADVLNSIIPKYKIKNCIPPYSVPEIMEDFWTEYNKIKAE